MDAVLRLWPALTIAASMLFSAGGLMWKLTDMQENLAGMQAVVQDHTKTLVRLDAHMQLTSELLQRRIIVSDQQDDRVRQLEQRVSRLERASD